jgi:hypothetical protein
VGPVGPPPHVRGTVDLDVLDDQVVGVQSLVLGVGLCVLQQVEKELARLGRPAALGGAVNLGLSVSAYTSHESSEGNDFLLCDDILEILGGSVEGHLLDGLGRLTGVLEVNPEVGSACLGTLGGVVWLDGVAGHFLSEILDF